MKSVENQACFRRLVVGTLSELAGLDIQFLRGTDRAFLFNLFFQLALEKQGDSSPAITGVSAVIFQSMSWPFFISSLGKV